MINIDNLQNDTYKLVEIFQNFENEYTAFSSNHLDGFGGGQDSVIIKEKMVKISEK